MYAYDFQTNQIPGEPPDAAAYWRDVGTIDAYYEANMDLRAVSPALNLYNREWPLRTASYPDPPAKFTFDDEDRRGQAIDSIVSGGCILSGGMVRNSVLGRGVRVHAGALVEDCVILDNCDIGRRGEDPARHPRQERAHPRRRHHRLRPRAGSQVPHGHRNGHRRGGGTALLGRHLLPADLIPSEGGSAPLPMPPPRKDCAGEAGARTAVVLARGSLGPWSRTLSEKPG